MKPHDILKTAIFITPFLLAFPLPLSAQRPRTTIITGTAQSDALKSGRNIEFRNAPPGKDTGEFGLAAVLRSDSANGATALTQNDFAIFAPLNSASVDIRSINSAGNVTGYLSSGSAVRSFVSAGNGNLTVFDVPNSSFAVSRSINEGGDVTGYFFDASGNGHSFVRHRDGAVTVFDAPNSLNTSASSINNDGDVTGVVLTGQGNGHGFVRYSDGRIIVFDPPHSSYTGAMSINANGAVTGFFDDENPTLGSHAFVRYPDGSITVFDPPGSVSTGAFSINRGGDVAGYFQYGSTTRGFVRYRNGTIIVFDPPNASLTFAYGINDNGDVTGSFSDASLMPGSPFGGKVRGFVRDRSGVMTVFDAPSASYTTSFSLNNSGSVTGFFWDANDTQLGFVRSK
jgi:hypothetical protein